jgi:hypothetical protein
MDALPSRTYSNTPLATNGLNPAALATAIGFNPVALNVALGTIQVVAATTAEEVAWQELSVAQEQAAAETATSTGATDVPTNVLAATQAACDRAAAADVVA